MVNESDLNHLFQISDALGRAGSNPVSVGVPAVQLLKEK